MTLSLVVPLGFAMSGVEAADLGALRATSASVAESPPVAGDLVQRRRNCTPW